MKPMRLTMTALALALFAPAGCTSVYSSVSPDANLTQYRTYAWYAAANPNQRQLAFERSLAGEVVRARIANDLARRGIQPASQNPDFLVAYHSKLEQKVDINDWGYPSLFWGAPPGPVTIDEYTEGTLFVDFIDPKTGQIFWRGTATAFADHPENPNLQRLGSAVDKVMKKYPAQLATAAPRQGM